MSALIVFKETIPYDDGNQKKKNPNIQNLCGAPETFVFCFCCFARFFFVFLGFALTKPWLFYFGFNKNGNFGSSGGLLVENQKKLGNFGIRKPKQQRNFGFSAGFLVKNPKTPCVCFGGILLENQKTMVSVIRNQKTLGKQKTKTKVPRLP